MKTKIVLIDEEPIYQRPRPLSPKEKEAIEKQITAWMKKGIVRPSFPNYASSIIIVPKKNNTFQISIDYQQLSSKIVKDRYPLPLIEDQLDKLRDAMKFTTLDLENGFFHLPMDEDSVKYTAFVTPNGHYEFLKIPFGLYVAPPVFQRFVNYQFTIF